MTKNKKEQSSRVETIHGFQSDLASRDETLVVLVDADSLPPLHGIRSVRVAGVDETGSLVSTSDNLGSTLRATQRRKLRQTLCQHRQLT